MLHQLIAEATECDFKEILETKKPKSWLKSVSAFANGIGGVLLFGVADESDIVGLDNVQKCAESISELIKARISPIPEIVLTPMNEKGKDFLALKVHSGRNTPYYYVADGVMQAFVRIGNSSVPAPEYILNELILKGSNRTFDSLPTEYKKGDYSFTLLEATYRDRTHLRFNESDYQSFGLVTADGLLTHAGLLMTDQHSVYNSRIFCTRWNGLEKGSVFEDAADDKEFEGNLIYLLQSACDFIRNNSKVRFVKEATERVDKPDYAERAYLEALVNALIHRDYIVMGKEIHIDMYDDRVEIISPGGMFEGRAIQDRDINTIGSARRNPIIADLFHRMRYMERRGSGLKKILESTSQLPGYTDTMKPVFYSTETDFIVVLKNINYILGAGTQVSTQDSTQVNKPDIQSRILAFCFEERSKKQILEYCGLKSSKSLSMRYLKPLLESGQLKMTIPDKPKSKNQKYIKG